jgi:hypothetical protein
VADEPSLSELARRLDDRVGDIREDIRELAKRLDGKVDQRVYDLRHEALASRVSALETLREKDTEKLVATRRWLIGAVIVPVFGVLLPIVIMLMRGAGK